MRDPNRLDKFYEEIKMIHKKDFTDLRFGQLMVNFISWYTKKYGDIFFPEEDKFLEKFKEFANDRR